MYFKKFSYLNTDIVKNLKKIFSTHLKDSLKHKVSGTLFSVCLSFLIVIVISSCIVAIFSYEFLYKNLETQTIESNYELLNQFKKSVDNYILKNIDKISLTILQDNDEYSDVMYFFSSKVEGNVSRINKIYNYLQSLKSLNSVIESIAIYYKNNNMIISSEGVKYLTLPNKPDWIDTDWVNSLYSLTTTYRWLDTRSIPSNSALQHGKESDKNIVTFIRKYPQTPSNNNVLGAIAVTISENTLYKTIEDTAPIDFGQIFVINKQGTIISHSDEQYLYLNISEILGTTFTLDKLSENGYFLTKVGGKKSVVSYAVSEYNNWTYVAVKPIFKIYEAHKYLDKIIFFISLFILLIGVILMLISAKRFYFPLKSLVRISKSVVSSSQSEALEDEYTYINNALNFLAFKIKEQEQAFEANLPILKHSLLLDLLNGIYYTEDEIDTKLKLLKIEFPYSFFTIIILSLVKSPSMNLKTFEYLKIRIINDLENGDNDFCSKYYGKAKFLCTEFNNRILIAANTDPDAIEIKHLLETICHDIKERYGVKINAAAGSVCNSILEIAKSYSKAQMCIKYSYIYPEQSTFMLDEVNLWELNKANYDFNLLDTFYNNLLNQDKTNALSVFKEIVLSLKNGHFSYDHTINYLYNILAYISDIMNKIKLNDSFFPVTDIYTHFNRIANINEFEQWISGIIEQIFEYSSNQQNMRNKEIVAKVKDFIKKNIINQDISLNTVADYFYLSPNYLSKIFKQETNICFIDYLVEARLEVSKELLTSGKLTIEEISSLVGYSSPQYFIRKFKSRFGKTPKQYQIESTIL